MKKVTMTQQKKSALCLAITLALSNAAIAQETTQTEEYIVWGTQVSSSSESIGAGDMSLKQADHMSDLLRDVPGVDVGGTHSLNQRINIRGLGESDLDIRLDGASQHANMFHHIGNLTLNPDILKSVDIEVGNNSVAQSGLGGAVYFETKNAQDLLEYDETVGVRVYGGYASNASQQGSMTVYGMLSENIDAMIYGHFVSNDDFTDGSGTENVGSAGDVYNIMGKIGFALSPQQRVEIAYDLYHDEGDYSPRPDMNGDANSQFSPDLLLPTIYERNTITLRYKLDTEQHKGKVSVYSTQTEIERDETETGWAGRESINTATNNNSGVNVIFKSDYMLTGYHNTLTYGADYLYQSSASAYGGVDYMDESAISVAGFIENQLYLADSWSITTGLRYDDYQRKAETGTDNFDALTWSLGTHWDINNNWAVFANARSLFKGPELLETFVTGHYTTTLADNMNAETGLNSQVGFSYDERLGDHRYGFNFTVFNTDIDDYIIDVYSSDYSSLTKQNSGDIEIQGFELSTTYGYEQFSGKLSYAKSDSNYRDSGLPVDNGDGISADIGDSIALTLDYYADSMDVLFGWTSIVVLEEDNVFEGGDNKAGYDTHNLYAQWLPAQVEDLTLTFGIDNIFDEEYISHASRSGVARGVTTDDYEPGRNIKLSAAYKF